MKRKDVGSSAVREIIGDPVHQSSSSSSRNHHHQNSEFPGQIQMGNALNPQTMSILPFNVTSEVIQISFSQIFFNSHQNQIYSQMKLSLDFPLLFSEVSEFVSGEVDISSMLSDLPSISGNGLNFGCSNRGGLRGSGDFKAVQSRNDISSLSNLPPRVSLAHELMKCMAEAPSSLSLNETTLSS